MKAIQNVVIQVAEEQHLSEERFVCNFKEDGVDGDIKVNKLDLTVEQLSVYDAFMSLITEKLSE